MLKPSSTFLRSREICPKLPESIHQIAGHIAKRTESMTAISPQELAMIFAAVLEEEKITDFELFPQLVDRIEREYDKGDEYATTFRKICREVIGIDPPIIVVIEEHPECVEVAAQWWVNAVLFRTDTAGMPVDFQKIFRRRYSEERVALFKATLARKIARKLAIEKQVWISSDWTADSILEAAGNKIGVSPLVGYPNATMAVYENEVKVTVGNDNTWETIFYTE